MNTNKPDPRLDADGKPLPLAICPKCGSPNDAATSADETDPEQKARPFAGDISVCFGCASIMQFQPDLTLKIVSLDELDTDDDTKFQVRRVQQKILEYRRDHPNPYK